MQLKAKNPKTNFTDVCPDDVVNAQFQIAGTTLQPEMYRERVCKTLQETRCLCDHPTIKKAFAGICSFEG